MSVRAKESFIPPLWILTIVALAFLIYVLVTLQEMVILLVLSFSVAYVMAPALDYLERKGLSREVSVIVVIVGLVLAILLAMATTIPTLLREYHQLLDKFPEYSKLVREKLGPLVQYFSAYLPSEWVEAIESGSIASLLALDENIPKRIANGLWQTLLSGYNLTLSLLNAVIFPFVVYYLAVDYKRMYEGLLSWVPFLHRRNAEQVLSEIDEQVSAYIRGQLFVGFVMFLMFATGLGIIGVELWLLVAFISGFGNLVPYVGSIVGVTLATIMALVTYGSFTYVLLVWGLYALVQFLEGTFITPKVIGDSVGISPLVVILALIAGGSLFGLLGIFLAVPVIAALKVIIKYLHIWVLQRAAA